MVWLCQFVLAGYNSGMEPEYEYESKRKGLLARLRDRFFIFLDWLIDLCEDNLRVIFKEKDVFFGAALAIIGVMHFRTGKYCDGNTADYLSCTRPVAYYYYGALEIFLVLIGVCFILLWILKRGRGEYKE